MLNGGIPVPFPVISIHETFSHPTSMYLRNLMAMDAEEMIRAQPMDAVVLDRRLRQNGSGAVDGRRSAPMCRRSCLSPDPCSPAASAASASAPAPIAAASGRKHRAGEIGADDIAEINNELAPTIGTCGVMGTASTMALAAEALGMMLPGSAAVPAVYADRRRIAEATGARAIAACPSG